jgi:hypothetical protein
MVLGSFTYTYIANGIYSIYLELKIERNYLILKFIKIIFCN